MRRVAEARVNDGDVVRRDVAESSGGLQFRENFAGFRRIARNPVDVSEGRPDFGMVLIEFQGLLECGGRLR